MINKILPITTTPITTNPLTSCYLSIILNKQEAMSWFYNNYIQLYCYKFYNDYRIKFWDPFYFKSCPFINYQCIDYGFFKISFNEIKNFLISSVENNNYIILYLNQFYISQAEIYFKKKHYLHETFIYGYDSKSDNFLIKEYYNGDFASFLLPYKELIKSFSNYNKAKTKSLFEKKIYLLKYRHANYNFNIDLFYNYCFDYINSKNPLGNYQLLTNYSEEIEYKYGLECYDFCINYFKIKYFEINQGKVSLLDRRILFTFLNHKEILFKKIAYLVENKYLSNSTGIPSSIYELRKQFYNLILILLRFNTLNKKSSLLNIIDKLEKYKKMDKIVFKNIIKKLHHKRYFMF